MNYYLITFIFLILVFLFLHIKSNYRQKNDIKILQLYDPNKDTLENNLSERYPTVITGFIQSWKGIKELEPNIVKDKGHQLMKDNKFIKLLNKYIGYYQMPLTIKKTHSLKTYQKGDTSYLKRQTEFRYYLIQIYGRSRLVLFSPKEDQNLYPTDDKMLSKVNYWKLEQLNNKLNSLDKTQSKYKKIENEKKSYLEQFPKINQANCIEIILSPGQMIYIPYNWWYTTFEETDVVRLTNYSKNIFSW